ncbi:MAG: sulfatase-like hydrolase/transferase [Sedimentisphaerales bacterium]|nr:sulfatase-like hydrolase/transferase [Sedimentisphaerales bacterium]
MAEVLTRRGFLVRSGGLAAGLASLGGCRSSASNGASRPNIVLIMADDLGYGDLGCYGCQDIRTPHIDGIAAEGVRFTTFYANAPECTPTRTALLTGRYQHRVGGLECALGIGNVGRYDDAIRLRETHDLGLPASEVSIARRLKSVGYATGICGKWHLGYEPKFFPSNHGFDHWFGPVGGAVDYFHHCEYTGENALYLNGKKIEREGYLTDLITDEAVDFIGRNRSRPFFLYTAYTAPHTPYQGPGDERPDPVAQADYNKGSRETFAAMVERLDAGVGAILDALRAAGVARNTLVIFMSDNGANRTGSNAPFSGYKGNLFEGGIRVPCVVKWPGVLPRGAISAQSCMTMDFSRSVVRAAGAPMPVERPFDGVDILRHAEKGRPVEDRTLFWRARRGDRTRKAVRDGSIKYIALFEADRCEECLFDLKADPAERVNLIDQQPETASRLKELLSRWEEEVKPAP